MQKIQILKEGQKTEKSGDDVQDVDFEEVKD